nr:uncharacterized protein LOC105705338 [Aotus nancymaae]
MGLSCMTGEKRPAASAFLCAGTSAVARTTKEGDGGMASAVSENDTCCPQCLWPKTFSITPDALVLGSLSFLSPRTLFNVSAGLGCVGDCREYGWSTWAALHMAILYICPSASLAASPFVCLVLGNASAGGAGSILNLTESRRPCTQRSKLPRWVFLE